MCAVQLAVWIGGGAGVCSAASCLDGGVGLVCAVQLAIWVGGGAGVCSAASCLDRGWGWCVLPG